MRMLMFFFFLNIIRRYFKVLQIFSFKQCFIFVLYIFSVFYIKKNIGLLLIFQTVFFFFFFFYK